VWTSIRDRDTRRCNCSSQNSHRKTANELRPPSFAPWWSGNGPPQRSGQVILPTKTGRLEAAVDVPHLQTGDLAFANANPDEQPAIATDKLQLEDRNEPPTNQPSDPKGARQNLSYLGYYAYSEVPPETKPADTVLKSLEDSPRRLPDCIVDRVSDKREFSFSLPLRLKE
jgi:hypothetical protein